MATNNANVSAIPHVGVSAVASDTALAPPFTYVAVPMLGIEKFAIERSAGVAFALSGA